jgi:hypothetical protein
MSDIITENFDNVPPSSLSGVTSFSDGNMMFSSNQSDGSYLNPGSLTAGNQYLYSSSARLSVQLLPADNPPPCYSFSFDLTSPINASDTANIYISTQFQISLTSVRINNFSYSHVSVNSLYPISAFGISSVSGPKSPGIDNLSFIVPEPSSGFIVLVGLVILKRWTRKHRFWGQALFKS